MYMNIYITRTNEVRLREVDGSTMSGLINKLLNDYFKNHRLPKDGALVANNVEEAVGLMKVHEEARINKMNGSGVTLRDVPEKLQPRFCKNGHPIPYPKDRCLGKGCKYS